MTNSSDFKFTDDCREVGRLSDMDSNILQVWQLIHDLGDQLAVNQKLTTTLQTQAVSLKVSPPLTCGRFV